MDNEAADGLCAFCQTFSFVFRLMAMTANNRKAPLRIFDSPNSPIPEVQLLSNGRYHVMITSAGGGYSRWNDLAVTRWREDGTCDNWGAFCYIRLLPSGEFWSAAFQQALQPSE